MIEGNEKIKCRKILRIICFLLIGVLLFEYIQNVLTLKWTYPIYPPSVEVEKAPPAQVVFLGPSHVYSNISPMQIYEEYGITSFDLASPAQEIQLSYDLLQELLKKWTPEMVMLEAGSLFTVPESELDKNYWDMALTHMPFSAMKIHNAVSFAQTRVRLREDSDFSQTLTGALVPIYRFHDRWEELNANDFSSADPAQYMDFTMGFWPVPEVTAGLDTAESMNAVAAAMRLEDETWRTGDGADQVEPDEKPIYNVQLDEINLQYFELIRDLCREKGVALQLVKTPNVTNPVSYPTAWTWQKHKLVEKYAQQQGIPFFDLLYDVDTGIDWMQDSFDGGWHLNVRGARKVSACLGRYLREICHFPAVQDPVYDAALPLYKQTETLAMQQTEPDFAAWVDTVLQSDRDLTVAIAVCEDMSTGLTPGNIQTLQKIGLKTDFGSLSFGDTFLAVWEHSAEGTNQIPYEAASNRELTYTYEVAGGPEIELLSRGGYQYANVSVKVDGVEQTIVLRGLHFIVYDRASEMVLDAMWADFSDGGSLKHFNSNGHLLQFERWLNQTAAA